MFEIKFWQLFVFGMFVSMTTRYIFRIIKIYKAKKEEEQELNENN